MISYGEDVENQIIEVTVDGYIERAEFQEVIGKIEQRFAEWGQIRLLKRIDSFKGIEPSLLIDDLKFAFNHYKHIQKVAVVSDKEWVETITKTFKFLAPCEVRCFENEEIDQARQWLK